MNKIWENGKKPPNFGPGFGLLSSKFEPKKAFSSVLPLLHYRKLSKTKRMIQTQENSEKPHFRSDLGPLSPNSGHQFFFQKSGFVSN